MAPHSHALPSAPLILTVPGIAAQGCGMFALPFLVGFIAALVFESSEVIETSKAMTALTLAVLFPIALLQVVGLALKSWRELAYWRMVERLTVRRTADVLFRHLSVVTIRGWTLLFAGSLLVLVALAVKWASFGLLAVLALLLFYAVTGWTVFASTFLVRAFARGAKPGSTIVRQMTPAVAEAGDTVEEVFALRGVPLPWGYVLIIEDPLPSRLKTESRYVIGRGRQVECRGRLRATPRGHYLLGPARLWYQDILGITRVSVASVATAELKVLPRFREIEIVDPPRTRLERPDILTRPHRFPTEDHFRFREYMPGDDTRRIHWRLSLRSGHLQVRRPETREIQTQDVVLALDSFMPTAALPQASLGAEELLDALVEAWLGLAHALVDHGDRVTLVAAVSRHGQDGVGIEVLHCHPGESARWRDLGARARWQSGSEIPELLSSAGAKTHGIVVTGRFAALPPTQSEGQRLTWAFLDPADAFAPPEPHWTAQIFGGPRLRDVARWALLLPHPAGSAENSLFFRLRDGFALRQRAKARQELRRKAIRRAGATLQEIQSRGDAVYRIDWSATRVRLVGIRSARVTP